MVSVKIDGRSGNDRGNYAHVESLRLLVFSVKVVGHKKRIYICGKSRIRDGRDPTRGSGRCVGKDMSASARLDWLSESEQTILETNTEFG